MRKTVSLSVTRKRQTAPKVKSKAKSGANATENEVIREGPRALGARETALEGWLRTDGVARFDAYHRSRSGGRPAAEVFARVQAHHIEQTNRRS
jgi:antitoxin ParD1/3/4